MATQTYLYPTTPMPETDNPESLHPRQPGDAGKMCMYKAMSGANTGSIADYQTVVDLTKPLRRIFLVPFDDDVWAVVLAFLFGFSFKGIYQTYQAASEACAGAANGEILYISIGAGDPQKSGHAIYAEKTNQIQYFDNEYTNDTSKINPKFNNNFSFLIFKRVGRRAQDVSSVSYKFGNLPGALVQALLTAREAYGDKRVAFQHLGEVTSEDIAAKYNQKAQKARASFKASKALLDAEITAFDTSMPKA